MLQKAERPWTLATCARFWKWWTPAVFPLLHAGWAALIGLGVAALPDFMIHPHVASGALAPVLTDYPPPDGGLYVVRPPGDFPPSKVRVLTDILLEYFGTGQSRAAAV